MKNYVKKSTIILGLSLIVIATMACAKTPDKAVVTDKSKGLAEESIIPIDKKNPKDLKIPTHWNENIVKSDGYVTIDANLDVQIPEIYNTPVYSYEVRSIDNKLLADLCNYFADGKKIYAEPEMTKTRLNEEKDKMIKGEDEWGYNARLSALGSDFSKSIDKLDALIESAPDLESKHDYIQKKLDVPTQLDKEKVIQTHDGKWYLWYYETEEKIGFTGRVDTGEVSDPIIRATTYDESVGSASAFSYTHGVFKDEVQLANDISSSHIMERTNDNYDNYLAFLKEAMYQAEENEFSKEEALKQVNQILKDLSIEGLEVHTCVKAIGDKDQDSWGGDAKWGTTKRYWVFCIFDT